MKHVLPEDTTEKEFPRQLAAILAKASDGDEIELPTNELCQVAAETLREDYPNKQNIRLISQEPIPVFQAPGGGPMVLIGPPPWLQGEGDNDTPLAGSPLRDYDAWIQKLQEDGRVPSEEDVQEWREREASIRGHETWMAGWFDSMIHGFIMAGREEGTNEFLDRTRVLVHQSALVVGHLMELARQAANREEGKGPEVLQELRDLMRDGIRSGISDTSNCQCPSCVQRREEEARAAEAALDEDGD